MTVSEVGDALMVSLKRDVNGACYGVFPSCPLMDLPNGNVALFYAYGILGRTIGNRLNLEVIGPIHLAAALMVILMFVIFLAKVFGIL